MIEVELGGKFVTRDVFPAVFNVIDEVNRLVIPIIDYHAKGGIYTVDRMIRKINMIIDEYQDFHRKMVAPLQLEILVFLGAVSELGCLEEQREGYGKVSWEIIKRDVLPKLKMPVTPAHYRMFERILEHLNHSYHRSVGPSPTREDQYYDACWMFDRYLWITMYEPKEILEMYRQEYIRNGMDPDKAGRIALTYLLNRYYPSFYTLLPCSHQSERKIFEFIKFLINEKKK